MKIAVEGCAHGELDKIYEAIQFLELRNSVKIDLLIICGDFQSVRNPSDMQCMAVPPKYRKLNTFYKYYSGAKKAPILTIFIGGNHEASNYLSELPYGGWVCPNIYYLGYANVINVGGIRIAGLSGIYKGRDYLKGHYEFPPYSESTKKSVYHVRNLDVFRLKQIKKPIDIFISHDWPSGVYNYGNKDDLLKWKPFFKDEMERNSLGSQPSEELLMKLKPLYWFAAHLHCKFSAIVPHNDNGSKSFTKFLALDKCLPHRKFLQVIDVESSAGPLHIEYDPEWLSILHSTNHLLSVSRGNNFMPGKGYSQRWDFSPSDEEMKSVIKKFSNDLTIPHNFTVTAPCYDPLQRNFSNARFMTYINPQTEKLCEMLHLTDPLALLIHARIRICVSDETSCDLNEMKFSDDSDDKPYLMNTSNTYLDVSECSDFFIDKTGSHSTTPHAGSGKSVENFSFPEIRKENLKIEAVVVKENPAKKFKRETMRL